MVSCPTIVISPMPWRARFSASRTTGREAARAGATAHLRDDAEGARVIPRFRDFEIRGIGGSGEHARREFMVEVSIKRRARRIWPRTLRRRPPGRVPTHGCHEIDFRDFFEELLAERSTRHGPRSALAVAPDFLICYFQNGVDGFCLAGSINTASVHDEDLRLIGAGS